MSKGYDWEAGRNSQEGGSGIVSWGGHQASISNQMAGMVGGLDRTLRWGGEDSHPISALRCIAGERRNSTS